MQTQPGFISQFGDVTVVLVIAGQLMFAVAISSQIHNGYYNLLMTKSGDRWLYFFAAFLNDFLFWNFVFFLWLMFFAIGGVALQGFWLSVILFAAAQPILVLLLVTFSGLARNSKSQTAVVGGLTLLGAVAYLWAIVLSTGLMWRSISNFKRILDFGVLFFLVPVDNLINAAYMSVSRTQYAQLTDKSATDIGVFAL